MSTTAIILLKSDAIGNGAFGHLRLKKSKKQTVVRSCWKPERHSRRFLGGLLWPSGLGSP